MVLQALRLSERLGEWAKLLADRSEVLDWVRHGVRIQFKRQQPRRLFVPNQRFSKEEEDFVTEEILRLRKEGCVERWSERPHMVCGLKVVPKAGKKKFRLVHNLAPVNDEAVEEPPCRFDGWPAVKRQLRRGDRLAKMDLRAGYHHLRLHPDSRTYCGFEFQGEFFVWNVLPLGLSMSPRVFTKTMAPVVASWRSAGVRCAAYLDDFLVMASPAQVDEHTQLVMESLQRMGFELAAEKCVTPKGGAQELDFLGLRLTASPVPKLSVPSDKRQAIARGAKQLVAAADKQEAVAIKKLARWMGQASSVLAAFFPTRAMLFWTQRCVSRAAAQRGWRAATTISKSARDELCWWAEAMRGATWGDRLLLVDSESTEFVLETDASPWGWGAVLTCVRSKRRWTAQDQWSIHGLSSWHINVLEVRAIRLALKAFCEVVAGRRLELRGDSVVALAAARRFASPRSWQLNREALLVAKQLDEQQTLLTDLIWIPSELNIWPDRLSRGWLAERWQLEWPLQRSAFRWLCGRWAFRPTVDAFATSSNAQCYRFWSRGPDPYAAAFNAFAQSWSHERLWCNPPFAMMSKVVAKLAADRPTAAIVIAPNWPGTSWFQQLQQLAIDSVAVPSAAILSAPHGMLPEPLRNPRWHMRAFLVR